jgi:putative transposase
MYDYRRMTASQRREAVEYRRLRERPWHSPPHWEFAGLHQFMISAACYEHEPVVGVTPERIAECESELLVLCSSFATNIYAWCVLPNHYHLLIQTDRLKDFRAALGKFHGRTSFRWNGEDDQWARRPRQGFGDNTPFLTMEKHGILIEAPERGKTRLKSVL